MDESNNLPAKRGRPSKSIKPKVFFKPSQEPKNTKISLKTLQCQYSNDFKLEKLEISTWQYIVSKRLSKTIFNHRMVELLKAVSKEFMLTELEYIAVISLLQQKNLGLQNIPISLTLDLICFLVKLRMETDEVVVKLLHQKLSEQYSSFDENFEILERESKININDLNKIYGDFQRIMIQESNYSVRVGEIVRSCIPYNKRTKQAKTQQDEIFKDEKEIRTTGASDSEDKKTKFLSLDPVSLQKSKDLASEAKRVFESVHFFLNNQEFESGFYIAEEFDSIA